MDLGILLTLRYDPTGQASDTLRRLTYKDISTRQKPTPSSEEIESNIRAVIRKYVIETNSKKISLALSTGIDSNVILYLIRDEFPSIDLHCVSVSFDENSEAGTAKKIAESKSCYFHNVIIDNPLKDLPYLISIVKEPRWNLYQYYFIEKSSQLSNLVFTGDGGDELFGGYTFRYRKFLSSYNEYLSWENKARLYLDCHDRDWVPDQDQVFGPNLNFDWTKIYLLFREYFDNDLEPLDQVFMADYHGKLMYDFVPTNRKFFDHFNILGVAPLLDPLLVNISLKMPPFSKYDKIHNLGKIPLREILRKTNIGHISNTKIGFGMDIRCLWNRTAKEIVISNLDNARLFKDKIISPQFYERSLKHIDDTGDVRYISKMLQLLSLEIWYKMFITFEISPKSSL